MKDVISLMGESESIFRLTTNEMYQPPSEPSRQEEFEHIVMNFILDQEARVRQLEDYMRAIAEEFMEFSSEVARRLKERIKENENKPRKIEKITKYSDTKVLENSAKRDLLENLEKKTFPTSTNILCIRHAMSKRARSTRGQTSSSREETMEERVCKFGLFDNGNHQMNYNNLVGRSIHSGDVVDSEFLSNNGLARPFFDFINTDTFSGPQWVNLFQINEPIFRELVREFFDSFEFDASPCRESRDVATLSGLRNAEMINATRLTHSFWPSIGDDMFNVGNTKAQSIRNPRIKLAHRCIMMTITGRKENTNRVTKIDLFYLYCIFGEGEFMIARSFGLLTNEMPATRGVVEEGDDEEGDREGGNEGVGGSADIYRNMSQGNSMAHKSIAAISHDEREELKKNGIKSPSKLFSPKYLSPASIKELNKNPSAPKRVHFVNSIVILSTDSDTEEDISSTNAHEYELANMVRRGEEVKEQGKEEDEMETDVEVKELIEEEESRFETDEEVEEIFEEEEEDEDDENFNSFPTMKEFSHHEWLLKNPRPRGRQYNQIMTYELRSRWKPSNPNKISNFVGRVRRLKIFIGSFAYECDFMILEDTTSIIDCHLGEMVFRRPFIDETGLVYNEEEGTVMFEKDDKKITFKMPHTMKIFKQTRLMGLSIDSIPPSAYEENFGHRRTHYYQSLLIGDKYKQNRGDRRGIGHLIRLEKEMMDNKGEVT
ncbi:hypothetical protein Tco_0582801 [Tanacetum coccineum]